LLSSFVSDNDFFRKTWTDLVKDSK